MSHGGSDGKGFQQALYDASSHHREPTWNNANGGGSDSRVVAQPVDDFFFPWEEAGSAEKPITIDGDEGFSETMTPQNTPPQQPSAMEPRPALRSRENLQNSLLLDSSLIKSFL